MASSLWGTLSACVPRNAREAPGAAEKSQDEPPGRHSCIPTERSLSGPLQPGAMGALWRQRRLFL